MKEETKTASYKIKLSNTNPHYPAEIIIHGGIATYFYSSPTSNCQLMSVGNFSAMSHLSDEELKGIFEQVSDHFGKMQFLFDVYQGKPVERIKSLFSHTLIEANYVNGTGSEMCILMTTLREYLDEDYEYDEDDEDDDDY